MSDSHKPIPGRFAIWLGAVAITAVGIAADHLGWLQPIENWLYDRRAEHGQLFTPPPTDQLVHLNLDDESLYQIGRWPWDRHKLAAIVDTLHEAGAKTIAFDIIFAEPQPDMITKQPDGTMRTREPDKQFAIAMANQAGCVLPCVFAVPGSMEQVNARAHELLRANPFLTNDQVVDTLAAEGLAANDDHRADWRRFRRAALSRRMMDQLDANVSPDAIAAAAKKDSLPHIDATDINLQLRRARTMHALQDKVPRAPASDTAAVALMGSGLGPVEPLASAASAVGHVCSSFDFDGVNRVVNPWITAGHRAYLQFGIAMAAKHLDIVPDQIELHDNRLVLTPPDGNAITIPLVDSTATRHNEHRTPVMRIAWRGSRGHWFHAYGHDPSIVASQHKSMMFVYQVVQIKEKLVLNTASMHDALLSIYAVTDPTVHDHIRRSRDSYGDLARIAEVGIRELADIIPIDDADNIPADLPPQERQQIVQLLAARDALQQIMEVQPALETQLESIQIKLRDTFEDKAVLIGWTAAGTVDYHVTPLHNYYPGFMIHSMVFNAVLTNDFLTDTPAWAGHVATACLALLLAFVWSRFNPIATLIASALLLAVWLAINVVVLFDYSNLVMGLACPLFVWAAVCATSMVLRLTFCGRATNAVPVAA